MERMRERQVADLCNPLKDIIGTTRMRNVWGILIMKNGKRYDIDDYEIDGKVIRFIESYGWHPVRVVQTRDVEELEEQPWRQFGRETTF